MPSVTRTTSHRAPVPPPAIESTTVGALGLFLPFLIVFAAAIAFGGHQPGQLVLSGLLVAFPVAILVMRARARRLNRQP